ncbi:sensor histidine kinase [Sinimarinibacterium sp. NLF-5-8]|nr:sensor histidine kinase [Sinimarinibacterium sp. NLF-5-8]
MELVAVVLTLSSGISGAAALERLLLVSLYLQWISLCSAGALCWARRWFGVLPPERIFLACWAMLVAIVMLISAASFHIAHLFAWDFFLPQQTMLDFVLRHGVIAAIVALMVLRYFWVRNQWTMQVQAEGEARYQALNARIRPHFLFNALNSLAALIQIRPDDAEMMVEDLSDLFRATLEKRGQVAALVEEIGLCHAYLRIEKMRLSDNLKVEWDVPEELLDWPVPKLVVQPLIENAVHHGVSRIAGGGAIRIAARQIMGRLVIEVANPMAEAGDGAPSKGNRIAIDNIAQRLSLIYGEGAQLEMGSDLRLENGMFRARLSIPATPRGQLPDAPGELASAQGEAESPRFTH